MTHSAQGSAGRLPQPVLETREDLLAVTVSADVVAVYRSHLPRGRQRQGSLHLEVQQGRSAGKVFLQVGFGAPKAQGPDVSRCDESNGLLLLETGSVCV